MEAVCLGTADNKRKGKEAAANDPCIQGNQSFFNFAAALGKQV